MATYGGAAAPSGISASRTVADGYSASIVNAVAGVIPWRTPIHGDESFFVAPTITAGVDVLTEPMFTVEQPGAGAEVGGNVIFDRIHVLPQTKDYGFIISPQTLSVEVWNANRVGSRTLDDIIVTGPEGVTVDGIPLPSTFLAFRSRMFDIEVSEIGGARALNDVHWDFQGIIEPHLLITGLRLVPFTIPIDWEEGIDDEQSWLTDLFTAYNGKEQRMQLREIPMRRLTYNVLAEEERLSGLLDSLLWAWQARSYGVPLWMHRSALTEDVALGVNVLPIDTRYMRLVVGMQVLVMADPFTWYASIVQDFTDTTITLETGVNRAFAKDDAVLPIMMGRLPDDQPVERVTTFASFAKVAFDLEVVSE